ncbi:YggS family pyridoxal phosphate-dependent enzyme [Thalassotalea sp. HSM 43]|uniref:YggS family pyridoxal phosphate-dependent enzyme n=1 Tax=Thalassotalea sp. HSM 43 TaxID=2552945 RepID=UPI0010817E03|nr:YggS family pyridoxal phosphate-dependent enzyme [Thalassotalea sp. HSM 43]QBY05059.1 YggS family pyridoxal phosphate-dependent enzyme [Thalassotalea sp. HSM 43]
MSLIADNLRKVLTSIEQSCCQSNRQVNSVNLLAVSKTKPAENIAAAYSAGQRHFGENYVQELASKADELSDLDIIWHFIGPIQSNKTRLIAEHADWVHSIDREKTAKRLNEQRDINITPLQVCLQVNISAEDSKSGTSVEQLNALAAFVDGCPNLVLRGLMCIPAKGDVEQTKQSFLKMAELFAQLQQTYSSVDTLSMGMSGDMDIAVECGSTMVRVGTAIFGSRD